MDPILDFPIFRIPFIEDLFRAFEDPQEPPDLDEPDSDDDDWLDDDDDDWLEDEDDLLDEEVDPEDDDAF